MDSPLWVVDHPRSRGVYLPLPDHLQAADGSSPLARGLPKITGELLADTRIIPARAGFTVVIHGAGWGARDHPRSRGVYTISMTWMICAPGSSPLARGLPNATTSRSGRSKDHPRSRGVYITGHFRFGSELGSSPLARGLHAMTDSWPEITRIIPARAGFTCAYTPETMAGVGSSPLARGLRRLERRPQRGSRIIPARAGFTPCFAGRLRPRQDHPRLRGVYTSIGSTGPPKGGSSPLARGLHKPN